MVSRTRLLLTCWVLGTTGCRVETLGVEVLAGGIGAISVADLQRDSWEFSNGLSDRGPGGSDERLAAERLRARLEQMRTLPGFDRSYSSRNGEGPLRVCARKEGTSDSAVVWMALDVGTGAVGGAVPRAVLVSLAKAWDTSTTPPFTLLFCAVNAEDGLVDYLSSPAHPLEDTRRIVTFGPLGDGESNRSESTEHGVPVFRFWTESSVVGTEEDRLEQVDYRRILPHVEELYDAGLEDGI